MDQKANFKSGKGASRSIRTLTHKYNKLLNSKIPKKPQVFHVESEVNALAGLPWNAERLRRLEDVLYIESIDPFPACLSNRLADAYSVINPFLPLPQPLGLEDVDGGVHDLALDTAATADSKWAVVVDVELTNLALNDKERLVRGEDGYCAESSIDVQRTGLRARWRCGNLKSFVSSLLCAR